MCQEKKRGGIFTANFEASRNVANVVKDDGYIDFYNANGKIGNIIKGGLLSLYFFGVWVCAFGIYLPRAMASPHKGDFDLCSYRNVALIGKLGSVLTPLVIVYLILWCIGWIYYMIRRVLPGHSIITFMRIGMPLSLLFYLYLFIVFLPLTVGFAITGTGVLGFCVQLAMVGHLLYKEMKRMRLIILHKLYGKDSDRLAAFRTKGLSRRAGILILLAVAVNTYTVRWGMLASEPRFMSFGYGILFLIIGITTVFLLCRVGVPKLISYYYFIKYATEYRNDWHLTTAQWYGAKKAKKLDENGCSKG